MGWAIVLFGAVWGGRLAHRIREFDDPVLEGLGNLFKTHRDGDRLLQLLIFNEEFLVSASHQLVLITSLPFVHTARRSYRVDFSVNTSDCGNVRIPNVAAES